MSFILSRRRVVGILAPLLTLFGSVHASAQSVEQFYRGKQVRFIIHTTPGGDYDIWARLLGRFMSKYVPGNPTFVPQNMPGGGGIIAANTLYTTAERDGTTIGMIGRNLPYQAAMKVANVRYDPAQFNWIGSPEVGNTVAVVVGGAPVKAVDDLYREELLMGGAGAGTAVSVMPVVLARLLGMKFKLVEGYGSATNVMLAMDRGEVHGLFITLTGAQNGRPGAIESGKLRVLFNMESKPVAGLGAPSIFELAKTEEQRQLLRLMSISNEFGRPVLAPPGVPADRLAALRSAFKDALEDKELLAEAAKAKLPVTYVSGEELAALVGRLNAIPRRLIEQMNELSK